MSKRRWQILKTPDGGVSGMIVAGATMGDGKKSLLEFNREFDGSEVAHEFDFTTQPPDLPGWYDYPEMTEDEEYSVARVVYDAYGEATWDAERACDARIETFVRGRLDAMGRRPEMWASTNESFVLLLMQLYEFMQLDADDIQERSREFQNALLEGAHEPPTGLIDPVVAGILVGRTILYIDRELQG